ncbi:MAG: PspA/IM30 family protein [Agarilytica sp.]
MNMWSKLVTALRGGLNEAGEAVIDSQALRILDQEVRDATEELKQSKDGLAAILARQKLAEEKSSQLQSGIDEYEGYASQALEKGDESLAIEVAQKVADLENQLSTEHASAKSFEKNANDLRTAIKAAEQNIKRMKQQVDTVKATENVQRAQSAVAERHSGTDSRLRTAMDSLERIKEKQTLKQAQMNAATELAKDGLQDSLDEKLKAAGIAPDGSSAEKVLERLKNK